MKEDRLQEAVFKYCKLQFPDKVIFHVPNEGIFKAQYRAKRSRMGVVAGIPDLLFCDAQQGYHGLAIELKVGSNKPTALQKLQHEKLVKAGWCVEVCYNLEECIRVIKSYFKKNK